MCNRRASAGRQGSPTTGPVTGAGAGREESPKLGPVTMGLGLRDKDILGQAL